MANIQRNFIAGRMNKSLDERLVPNGEYINAFNVRLGSTEDSEIGAVENSKGNVPLTALQYVDGTPLSSEARCIGAFEDGANLAIYWFVHDPAFTQGATGKLDLIVSFDVETGELIYHVISIDDGNGINTTLNFNSKYLVTAVNKIDNLVFFTDNYNPPRVININKNYGDPRPAVLVDDFNKDDILVIRKPPTSAPTINLYYVSSITDGYLQDKFLCFAYRYKYENNEYSAISQFTEPTFTPSVFNFSVNSYLNEGMVNQNNALTITYNTGSSKVTDIQLVFKEADSNTIKVIENINKKQNGFGSNETRESTPFTNRKIFTVLPDSEILRLYDNVPQLAKAQTLMGNRLVYGNYFEGYDLITSFGGKVDFQYNLNLLSEEIDLITFPVNQGLGLYSIDYGATGNPPPINIDDSVINVDMSSVVAFGSKLKTGTVISFSFGFQYSTSVVAQGGPPAAASTGNYFVNWSYTLQQDFDSVYDLVNSTDFYEKIGSPTTIQTVANAANGNTLTDVFNLALPQSFDSNYTNLIQTGVTSTTDVPAVTVGQPIIRTDYSENSNTFGLQILAAVYEDPVSNGYLFVYHRLTDATVIFQSTQTAKSLHSNRGYEIGMVYMDDFNRASTAQVSPLNSVNLPCSVSSSKNSIQVNIPPTQLAPYWATKYKFVIKPTATDYQTIYSNIVYRESGTGASYFLLDGENANKVESGDSLIVKSDARGPISRCAIATVLEKEPKASGFIDVFDAAGNEIEVFGGTYMKINASNFAAVESNDAIVSVPEKKAICREDTFYPVVAFPFFTATNQSATTPVYDVYDVPVGTRITMRVEFQRNGGSAVVGSTCQRQNYILEKDFTASRSYTNMIDWFNGDNVDQTLDEGIGDTTGSVEIETEYISTTNSVAAPPLGAVNVYTSDKTSKAEIANANLFGATANDPEEIFYFRMFEDTSNQDANGNNLIYMLVSGGRSCSNTANKRSELQVSFTVYRTDSMYVFETKPVDALPDVWYENSKSFDINGDYHLGNVQNQTNVQPAIIDTGFANCYTFGNGVESYRIKDSIKEPSFNLGNRVFSTSNEEFKAAHRFADLTYSGVFNDESNVNRLNEFNLGLLNFKPLEETYGDVEKLFARETDILVLQEDKISYVLAGKNLLSDSTGGGVVTSVPEVLGQQISRIEQYGISNHPESFAAFGENKYFTDAKRNVVVKLTGTSAQNEILTIISNEGMRSWFRDLFSEASATQKLGGYDPYMHEYVFSTNTIIKPETELCTACGVTKNVTIVAGQEYVYCVEIGEDIGPENQLYYVEIDYVIPFENTDLIVTEGTEQQIITEGGDDLETEGQTSGTGYTIDAVYDGVTYTTGVVYQSGTLVFPKPNPTPTEVVLIVSSDSIVDDTIQITTKCPEPESFSIYSVTLTTNANAGKFSHTEFLWQDSVITSPTQSDLVTFATSPNDPIISQYRELEGAQGSNIIPPNGATIIMRSNKINFDNFQFDPTENQFRYLRTDALYQNNSTDINILLAASVEATPINSAGAPNLYTADFTLPAQGNKLYLLYDLRQSNEQELCYSPLSYFETCCDCVFTPTPAPTVAPTPAPTVPVYNYFIGIDCTSLQAVYLKSDVTLGVVVGDEVQYSSGGAVAGCASLYATDGNGNNGEITVIVSGCGDSRCSI